MKYIILIACCLIYALNTYAQHESLTAKIDSILKDRKATVGAAFLFNSNNSWTYNNQHHYPLLSVCKYHLALCVLDQLNQTNSPLDTDIFVRKADLHTNTYSPLREERPEGDFNITVGELLKYSVALSDNNACDILFKFVGGPAAVERYAKTIGVADLEISVTEDQMHQNPSDQYLNWTTPLSAVKALDIFLNQELFAPVYKKFLEATLIATSTGSNKIKALLPRNAIVGHKTGSSDRTRTGMKIADNDIGFIRTPKGKVYTIAVFVTDSMEDDKTNAAIIAEISKAIFDYIER